MDTKQLPFDTSITEIAEKAADLAARAVGSGLAKMIEVYVPPHLARRFAARVIESLLADVLHQTADLEADARARN